jgi:hypothetical protein
VLVNHGAGKTVISYAAPEDSVPKRAMILIVERLSGRQRIVRAYQEARRAPSSREVLEGYVIPRLAGFRRARPLHDVSALVCEPPGRACRRLRQWLAAGSLTILLPVWKGLELRERGVAVWTRRDSHEATPMEARTEGADRARGAEA